MKKLIYSTYFDRETENGEIETVTVEGSTIIPDGDLEDSRCRSASRQGSGVPFVLRPYWIRMRCIS